jgi:hypothetical protein
VSGRQMWADDGQNDDERDVLSPASRGSTRLDLSLSYALAAGPRVGMRASWYRHDGGNGQYSFGPPSLHRCHPCSGPGSI